MKKLKEERHLEELKKLQVEAGIIPKSHLDRMDWMYDWVNNIILKGFNVAATKHIKDIITNF